MKQLKKHWSARPLSMLLSVLMALPVLGLFLLRAPAAQAQLQTARQPTWAVLDFANPSGYGSSDVGRLASDSFVVQLGKLNRYSVLPREQLLTGIQTESLTPPLNLSSIERLGQSLGVDAIVAGEISSISFSRDRRQARVSLAIRVIDPKSGFLLNGALAEGLSNPRPIPVDDEEQLVNEAFGNAAFNAVRQLSKFALPVATVLISGNNTLNGHNVTVTINKGARDGMYPGLDMLISRNGLYIGTIRIADASDNDSNAQITDRGLGIEPGDRATAIYHLPAYTVDKQTGSYQTATSADLSADAPTTGGHRNLFGGLGGILGGLVATALLLAGINTGKSDHSLGGANVSGVSAVAGRATTVGGGATNIPLGYPTAGNFLPVAVRITANIGNIQQTNFLEFHVYRSDSPSALSSASSLVAAGVGSVSSQSGNNTGNTNTNSNGNNNGNNGNTNTSGNSGGLLGINGFGQVPLFAQASKGLVVYDDFNLKTAITASKPDPSDSSTLVTLSVSTFGVTTTGTTTTGTTTVNSQYVNGIPGTGLGFGSRVSYAIEGLYIQPATFNTGTINPGTGTSTSGNTNTNTNTSTNTSSGTTTGNTTGTNTGTTNTSGTNTNTNGSTSGTTGHGETFQLTGLRTTNTVTYIEPVAPFAASVTNTGPTNVNVTVPATAGANDYILEISADPGFSSKRTYRAAASAYSVPSPQTNPNQSGATSGTVSVANGNAVVFNNINLTTDFSGSGTLFYRVGARDSSNGGSTSSNPYVYSDPLSLGLSPASMRDSIRGGNFTRTRPHF